MKELFENIKRLFGAGKNKLLSNNTGYSIKSWFLWGTALAGLYILLVVGFVLIWDVVVDGKVDSVLSIPEIIESVSKLFIAAGLPKIAGEIGEKVVEITKKIKNNDQAGTDTTA